MSEKPSPIDGILSITDNIAALAKNEGIAEGRRQMKAEIIKLLEALK